MNKNVLFLVTKESDKTIKFVETINNKSKGVNVNLGLLDDVKIKIDTSKEEPNIEITLKNQSLQEFDFITFRPWMKSNKTEIVYTLSKYFQNQNIKFADSFSADISYSFKIFQNVVLALNGYNIPKSLYIPSTHLQECYTEILDFLGEKFVIKASASDKGKNNFLIDSEEKFNEIMSSELNMELDYICQEFIENNFDYRILVTNYKTGSVERRIRQNENEHRNNASVGGIEEFISKNEIDQSYLEMSEKIAKLFRIDICGIDIIVSRDNKPYILEANSLPGITYGSTEEDAIIEYFNNI